MNQETIDYIALGLIKGIGPKLARRIIELTNSVSEFFDMSEKELSGIDRLYPSLAKDIVSTRAAIRQEAQAEAEWVESYGMDVIAYNSDRYPARLRSCDDAPLVMYARGKTDFNARMVVSVVGTRKPTPWGRQWCADVLSALSNKYPDLLVVSGLAYGIDVASHVAAMDNGLKTVGVVAHGMDTLYPAAHKDIAKRMVQQGGAVLTEFRRGTQPEAVNFVSRNRIVAGMADIVLVVESGEKGGSLITASKAYEYGRTVAAMPGSPSAEMSKGPNTLIREHKAELVTSAEDIENLMGWNQDGLDTSNQQGSLFAVETADLNPLQSKILEALTGGDMSVDELSRAVPLPVSEVSTILLEIEFMGVVSTLPGNRYCLLKC